MKAKIQQQKQLTPITKNSVEEQKKSGPVPELQFTFLGQDKADEAAKLYTMSFVYMNSMWKQMGASYEEVFSVNRGRMIACSKAGWTCGMVNPITNQIAAVAPSMDLVDYIDTPVMPSNSLFLKSLSKYAIELQKEYFAKMRPTLKRGECLYNYGGAVQPKYAKGGISRKFWAIGTVYIKVAGFKIYFSRATSRITTKLLTEFGGEIVKSVDIGESGVKGEKMELIRLDLTKLSYETLSKYYEDANENDDIL